MRAILGHRPPNRDGRIEEGPDGFAADEFKVHMGPITTPEYTCKPIKPDGNLAKTGEFYVDYRKAGSIIGRYLNRPEIRYIGHFCSADTTWMMKWLNLDVFGKFCFDTAFAKQTIDEYAPLGLERLALECTNFGRYDIPLVMAKKELKIGKGEGYARIPDSVLVNYGGLDVIVPLRVKPILEAELRRQGTLTYYQTIVLPLVSDTFTHFSYTGLPVDRELFEATRKFMNWAYRELLKDFLEAMAKQADEMVATETGIPVSVLTAIRTTQNLSAKAWVLSQRAEVDELLLDHWVNVHLFNIRSGPVMTRWLFDVMKFTPVKSTGKPPMMWEKVLALDPKMQKNFTPAADKETIEILFEQDDSGLLRKLLDLSNVGNICKGFLKEGEYDQDGELVKEAGLGKHIAMDGFLHAMFALTETCRPRCIAGDCEVLTGGRGLVPLKDVTLDDLVWDGEDWVEHDGVIEQGVQRVYEYQGLWATLNHQVWVYNDAAAEMGLGIGSDHEVPVDKVDFGTAIQLGWDLVPGEDGLYVSGLDRYDGIPVEDDGEDPKDRPNKMAMTYDLLNAGPNRRFTCASHLVSNSWAPNSLNLSKYLNKYIARALLRVLENVEIPKEFEILFGSAEEREGMSLKELIKERVPSVRSVVKAEEGGCFVESDYKTAEIRACPVSQIQRACRRS